MPSADVLLCEMNLFHMSLERFLYLKNEMGFTDNESTVPSSESFAKCAISRDRCFEFFLRLPALLTHVLIFNFPFSATIYINRVV